MSQAAACVSRKLGFAVPPSDVPLVRMFRSRNRKLVWCADEMTTAAAAFARRLLRLGMLRGEAATAGHQRKQSAGSRRQMVAKGALSLHIMCDVARSFTARSERDVESAEFEGTTRRCAPNTLSAYCGEITGDNPL